MRIGVICADLKASGNLPSVKERLAISARKWENNGEQFLISLAGIMSVGEDLEEDKLKIRREHSVRLVGVKSERGNGVCEGRSGGGCELSKCHHKNSYGSVVKQQISSSEIIGETQGE